MLEHVAGISYISYIGIFIFIFVGQIFYLRNRIWNLFDPLILIILNVSLNASIVIFLYVNGQVSYSSALYIMIATILFCLGLKGKEVRLDNTNVQSTKALGLSPKITVIMIAISVSYQLIAIVFMFKHIGFGILTGSVNPDTIKVTLTQDGLGIFRHIGSAGDFLFLPLVAHALFTYKMRRLVTACVLFYLLKSIVFPMSKSGLVFIVFDLGILMYYYKINLNCTIVSTKKVLLIATAGIIPALVVLVNVTTKYETTIPALIVERLIVTGFGTYQYFVSGGMVFLENISSIDKFNYYFDTILSLVRIKAWEEMTYVANMTYQISGSYLPGFGANPYLYLDGHFLFGWGGVFYCYAIGAIIAFTRALTTNILLFYIAVKIGAYLVADPAMAQAQLFTLMFYLPPVLLLYLGAKCTNARLNSNLLKVFGLNKVAHEKA